MCVTVFSTLLRTREAQLAAISAKYPAPTPPDLRAAATEAMAASTVAFSPAFLSRVRLWYSASHSPADRVATSAGAQPASVKGKLLSVRVVASRISLKALRGASIERR